MNCTKHHVRSDSCAFHESGTSPITGRSARRKGHDFERAVAAQLARVFGCDKVHRGFQYRNGSDAPDVVCPGFWVECKRGRRTNSRAALRQAVEDASGKGLWALAVCKDDRDDAYVVMNFDDFVDLLTEWHQLKIQ